MEKSSFKRKQANGIDSSSSGKEFKKTTPHHHHKGSPSGHPQKYDKHDKHPHKDFKKSKKFNKPSFFSKLWAFIAMVFTCGCMRHSNKPSPNAGEVRHCKGCTCSKETAPKHNPKPHYSKTDEAPVANRGPKQANTTDECEAPQPVKARLTDEEIAKYKAQFHATQRNPESLAMRYRRPYIPAAPATTAASEPAMSEDEDHSVSGSEHESDVNAHEDEEFDALVDSDDE
jgi:hypothetical protein